MQIRARLATFTTTLLAAAAFVATSPASAAPSASAAPDFGPNVVIVDPSMSVTQIKATADGILARQEHNEFGTDRVALLFKPGTYGSPAEPLTIQVGYYTEVAGLGASPTDVVINGHVDVYNQCDANGCIALNNFWRSLSNLTINVTGLDACRASGNFWAVSQASPMRRVNITGGNLTLMDYCTAGPQYASGGFMADSRTQFTINGSQQQFYVRNRSSLAGATGSGTRSSRAPSAHPQSFGRAGGQPYTTLETTPVSKEKPYLYVDGYGRWMVRVPSAQTDSRGVSWADGMTPGRSIPLSDFIVLRPGDSIARVNAALAAGRHLLVTPGVHDVSTSLAVKRAGTVILGLGLETLTAQGGSTPIVVDDVPGVGVAGLTIDAGPVNSPVLLQVGTKHSRGTSGSSAADPIALQDVFFRIGGPHVGKADVSLAVDADHVLLDDLWVWRADHGSGVGWSVNTADHGAIVRGNDVTATGFFVEHYQKENVIWEGERGRTVFFQNELPYDAPNQAAWTSPDGSPGYPAYRVGEKVTTHEAWGLGAYIYTNVEPSLHAADGFVVPAMRGVRMHDLLTVSLNHAGTIDHVINGVGAAVTPDRQGPEMVVSYP